MSYVFIGQKMAQVHSEKKNMFINMVVPNYLQKNMIIRGCFLNFTCLTLLGCKTRSLMRTCTTALLTLVMESGEKLETNSTNNPQNVYVAGMMIAKSVW